MIRIDVKAVLLLHGFHLRQYEEYCMFVSNIALSMQVNTCYLPVLVFLHPSLYDQIRFEKKLTEKREKIKRLSILHVLSLLVNSTLKSRLVFRWTIPKYMYVITKCEHFNIYKKR